MTLAQVTAATFLQIPYKGLTTSSRLCFYSEAVGARRITKLRKTDMTLPIIMAVCILWCDVAIYIFFKRLYGKNRGDKSGGP